jgi:plasmid stabilization system protein ParE
MRPAWTHHALQQLHALQFRGEPVRQRAMAEQVLEAVDRLVEFPRLGRATVHMGVRVLLVGRTGLSIRYRLTVERIEILDLVRSSVE